MEEENIKLVREYSLDTDILRNGCIAYQKKYVYPGAFLKAVGFLVLAANFVYGIVNGPTNTESSIIAYLLIMLCLGIACIVLFNPLKQRRSIIDGFLEMESKPVYRLTVTDKNIGISTVSEVVPDDAEDDEVEAPEDCVFPIDNITVMEKDKFFLLMYAKMIYYIVPKENFSEDELEIVRNIAKN